MAFSCICVKHARVGSDCLHFADSVSHRSGASQAIPKPYSIVIASGGFGVLANATKITTTIVSLLLDAIADEYRIARRLP